MWAGLLYIIKMFEFFTNKAQLTILIFQLTYGKSHVLHQLFTNKAQLTMIIFMKLTLKLP